MLASFWKGPGTRPNVTQLACKTKALLLLRCGTLTGWLGSGRQREGWQENAKDLLSETLRLAVSLGETELWAEAANALAVCYWRGGAYSEARILLRDVIDRAGKADASGLLAAVNLGMVERCEGHLQKALELYRDIAAAVQREESDALKSFFHNEFGCVLMQAGSVDQAIIELTAACVYFERSGHVKYRAAVENNLGYLFMTRSEFEEAQSHFERAETLFSRMGDAVHLAQTKDSRAVAYLAEKNYAAAVTASEASVKILELGEEHALLVDSLLTLAESQSALGRPRDALVTYVRAYELAADRIGSKRAGDVALKLIGNVAGEACLSSHLTYDQAVANFEAGVIAKALKEEDGNQTRAAMRIGMSQQALSYLLGSRHGNLRPPASRGRRRKDDVKQTADVVEFPA